MHFSDKCGLPLYTIRKFKKYYHEKPHLIVVVPGKEDTQRGAAEDSGISMLSSYDRFVLSNFLKNEAL